MRDRGGAAGCRRQRAEQCRHQRRSSAPIGLTRPLSETRLNSVMRPIGFLRGLALGLAVAVPAGAVHCALMPLPVIWTGSAAAEHSNSEDDDAGGHCCSGGEATHAPHGSQKAPEACPCIQLASALVPQLKVLASTADHHTLAGTLSV